MAGSPRHPSQKTPPLRFRRADPADAGAVAELLAEAAAVLTATYGSGPWSRSPSERGVLAHMRGADVWLAFRGRTLAGTWALGRRKPWAIDLRWFDPAPRSPRYLTDLGVAPAFQGQGAGRGCLEHAIELARADGADALRLDAYAGDAGGAGFYAACGFREVGRARYRGTPLVYLELTGLAERGPGQRPETTSAVRARSRT